EQLTITVTCSKGTYIRVLAADIGEKLGCGAYLTALRRTQSGCFSVDEAIDGEGLFHNNCGKDCSQDSGYEVGADLLISKIRTVEQALENA
ncbi:tRNA pseudouridine(55) synthase, partial [Candidatus Electrothrix marina]